MTKKVRIGFLTPQFPTELNDEGGLSNYLGRISQTLVRMGHHVEVFVLSQQMPRVLDHSGVRVERVTIRKGMFLKLLGLLANLPTRFAFPYGYHTLCGAYSLAQAFHQRDREVRFDVVQSSDYCSTGLFVRQRSQLKHVVRCSWAHDFFMQVDDEGSNWDKSLQGWLERRVIRRADLSYAPSQFVSDHYKNRYAFDVQVIRPPAFIEDEISVERNVALPTKYLCHFGLFCRRKGTDLIAKALPIVWDEESEFRMVWIGREKTPGFIKQIQSQWGERQSQVLILEPKQKPELYAIVKGSLAAVLPSRADNLPNTVIESLALQIPVIGSDGASINELVVDEVSGKLVEIGNVEQLAEAMIQAWKGQRPFDGQGFSEPMLLQQMQPEQAASTLLDRVLNQK